MYRPTSLIFAALLTLPIVHASQDGDPVPPVGSGQEYDARVRPPLDQYREQRATEIEASLDGAWRMTRFIHAEEARTDTKVEGLTIFRQGFGSTVAHAEVWNADFAGFEEFFQGMAFRYQVDESLRLQTSTILGHRSLEGQIEIEIKLEPREYKVEVLGDQLILTRTDGTRLQYQRLVNEAFPEKTLKLIQQARGRSVTPNPGPGLLGVGRE